MKDESMPTLKKLNIVAKEYVKKRHKKPESKETASDEKAESKKLQDMEVVAGMEKHKGYKK